MPEERSGVAPPGSLAEEALRRGKRFRRRRRRVGRAAAGLGVAVVSAGVALGIAIRPAPPGHVHHPVQAVTTTSSLPLHGPRSHPTTTHHPAKKAPAHTTTT